MVNCDRSARMPKNKLKACALCLLLCFGSLIEVSEARKVVGGGRVTKPTANRGYANPDIAKLSYSPSQSAAPRPASAPAPAAAPAPAPAQQPAPIGWNVPNNAPPSYSAHPNPGPPPAYSPQANPNVNTRFNEPPPSYANSNPGFGAPPSYHAGGYPAQPAPSYPGAPMAHPGGGYPQPGGFPPAGGYQPAGGFPSGGYPQQPGGYQPGGFQQPGTVIHHYEQPSSGSSGIGTVLGAGVAGLAAGVGGAALYDALKPEDSKEPAATTSTTTTTTTTLAPINPNGDAPLAPLVPANGETTAHPPSTPMDTTAHAAGETPATTHAGDTPLAPMPAETTTHSENPSSSAPLAPFPSTVDAGSSTGTSPETTAASTVAVEAQNAALNVQPNLAAAPQLSAEPSTTSGAPHHQLPWSSLALLLPVLCKWLLL